MTDILVDNTLDLEVALGDFATGESTSQEVQAVIMSYPGWWKQFPLVGCSAPDYQASPGDCEPLRRQIQIQLKGDSKQLTSFTYYFQDETLVLNVNGNILSL